MRVLHTMLDVAPRNGGPSTVLPEMCRALIARGHEVEILTTNLDGDGVLPVPTGRRTDLAGVPITYFNAQLPRYYRFSSGLAQALWQRVRDVDIVHIHSLYLFHGLVAGLACRRAGVPYVVRPHGTLNPKDRARHTGRKAMYEWLIERRHLDRAAAIHCTSAAEAEGARRFGVRAPVVVVPHGVEVGDFERPVERSLVVERFPELAGKRLVTFLGRIAAKKRLDLVVDAFAQVAAAAPDAHLVIAGPDNEGRVTALQNRLESFGLARRATFTGMVRGDMKVGLLQGSAAYVLPSEDENFAVAVVEAMAAGTPVVISDGVGIYQEVATANAGLVASRTASGVAEAILRLLNDEPFARQCGANGRVLVRTTFTWEQAAAQLEDVYRKSIERSARLSKR